MDSHTVWPSVSGALPEHLCGEAGPVAVGMGSEDEGELARQAR